MTLIWHFHTPDLIFLSNHSGYSTEKNEITGRSLINGKLLGLKRAVEINESYHSSPWSWNQRETERSRANLD